MIIYDDNIKHEDRRRRNDQSCFVNRIVAGSNSDFRKHPSQANTKMIRERTQYKIFRAKDTSTICVASNGDGKEERGHEGEDCSGDGEMQIGGFHPRRRHGF